MEKDTNISQPIDAKAVSHILNNLPGGGQGATINFINAIYVSNDTDNQEGNRTHIGNKVGNVNYTKAPTENVPKAAFADLALLLESLPMERRFDTLMRMALEISMTKNDSQPSRAAHWVGISRARMEKFVKSVLRLEKGEEIEVS